MIENFPLILAGMGTGLSLIVAIGAQNAFVLKQGIIGKYIAAIVAFCIFSDALLIGVGIFTLGKISDSASWLLEILRWGGGIFLLWYGFSALKRALHPSSLTVDISEEGPKSLSKALAVTFAITYLNPHVYLDTVALLGSLANTYGKTGRWWYYLGTVCGSTLWFSALGFGSRFLRPIFAKPGAWRILDFTIAALMVFLAFSIMFG